MDILDIATLTAEENVKLRSRVDEPAGDVLSVLVDWRVGGEAGVLKVIREYHLVNLPSVTQA